MSRDSPTYLASLQNNIRQRPIPWDGAVRSGLITDDHLAKIRAVDRAKKADAKKAAVDSDLDAYTALFVGEAGKPSVFESAAKQPSMIQYLLVLLADILESSPQLATRLLESDDPYRSFRPLLHHSKNPDDPIPLLASKVLTRIMASARDKRAVTALNLPETLAYLSGLVGSGDAAKQDIAIQQYSDVLGTHRARLIFWERRDETVRPLVDILRSAAGLGPEGSSASLWSGNTTSRPAGTEGQLGGGVGLQLLYHVLLVMWQLAFEAEELGDALDDEYDIVILYTQLLRISPKEKTSRLIIHTFRALLEKNQRSLLPTAVLARLPSVLANVAGRHYADPELLDDLAFLTDLLEEYTRTKTTFDEYVAEVNSGHLRWSPPHRNAMFWAENARKILEYEKGSVPVRLAEIMAKPWDQDKAVLAIACNDVGHLVREAPERRHALEKLGLKRRIMELMDEADENVRWESLRALGGWLKYSFDSGK